MELDFFQNIDKFESSEGLNGASLKKTERMHHQSVQFASGCSCESNSSWVQSNTSWVKFQHRSLYWWMI